ncbi:hypothetical protein Pan216_42820 [Planctomycetes bacterium Pan216]|uniref:Uncharacterized protein n=1 Tax=Kolteria novifilia TaxID=2527975 RepID=A0A518B8X1_9BACT|nr:hypothetical protein Pan216_42820 [Planctomycetes bacterium Pan216]
MRRRLTLLALSFLTFGSLAYAQVGVDGAGRYGGGGGWGYYPWGGQFQGTGAEGNMRGAADVIRARGQSSVDYSQARLINAKASSAESQAREDHVKSFFESRRINQDYKAYENSLKYHPTQADLTRHAEQALPDQMTASQLDPLTGKINWPQILTTEDYTEPRDELDKLFKERAETGGGLGTFNYQKIISATKQMTDTLKEHIRAMDTSDYLLARNFLNSLSWTARTPAH